MIKRALLPAFVCLLLAGCGWTTGKAREEAFRNVQRVIDVTPYPPRDPHFQENQQAIGNGVQKVGDRFVSKDPESPVYLVSEFNEAGLQSITMSYTDDGHLVGLRLFSHPNYPRTGYVYCAEKECPGKKEGETFKKGELMFLSFFPSHGEVFNFSDDGILTFHERY